MKWGVWCEWLDGRKNGGWVGENYDGVRLYSKWQEASLESHRKGSKFPHCEYSVREYVGDE